MAFNKCNNCGAMINPAEEHRHWDCVVRLQAQREKLKAENQEFYTALQKIADMPSAPDALFNARAIARMAIEGHS